MIDPSADLIAGRVHRRDIDGLRAVAVIPVVLYHAGISAFHGGFVGVDIFFVISGFLITSILYRDVLLSRYSILGFYERRIRRIIPALFVMLLASSIAAVWLLLPEDLSAFGHSVAWTTVFASNVEFYRHASYFAPSAITQPLLHTWSLGVEEQFYIGFPLLLFLLRKRSLRAVLCVIAVIAALSLGLSAWRTAVQPDEAFYLPHTRVWELLLGSLAALAGPLRKLGPLTAEVIASLGLGLIVFSFIFYSSSTPFPGIAALTPCLGAAMLLVAGREHAPVASRLLSLRPLTWIGLISYSLYLWHWPVFVFSHYWAVARLTPLTQLGMLGLVLVLATASYWFVERPFRRPRNDGVGRRRVLATAAVLSATAGGFGLVLSLTGGLPGRFDPAAVRLADTRVFVPKLMACSWGPKTAIAKARPCEVGPGAEPTFLVWGDSHAVVLYPAIAAIVGRSGGKGVMISYQGCPPLVGVMRSDKPQFRCLAFNERVLGYIKTHPSIRRVVLVGWWPYYLTGHLSSWTAGDGPAIGDADAPEGRQDQRAAVFGRGVERTFRALHGVSVAVLADVPDTIESVPMVMAKQDIFHRPIDIRPRTVDYLNRQRQAISLFDAASSVHPFTLYRAGDAFCGPQVCRIEINGQPLYGDDNHVTTRGAIELEPLLERAITGGVERPS